jgi:AcrR family transcriptional regulator
MSSDSSANADTTDSRNKHATRSARTRDRFIEVAQQLFAERSIDSVSLNEITVAAQQKNRNALQYHFGNRDGLLQAIIDRHATRVHELRAAWLRSSAAQSAKPSRRAARGLVYPLAQYIEENPTAVHYIKILSQLAALNNQVLNPQARSSISFQSEDALTQIMTQAIKHLQQAEAQRRLFLSVSITFHGMADACRAFEATDTSNTLKQRPAMFEQVALAVESLLAAPAL